MGRAADIPSEDFWKTQLCIDFFHKGSCPLGAACRYAHSTQEIRRTSVPKKGRLDGRRERAAPRQQSDIHSVQAQISELQTALEAMQAAQPPPLAKPEQDLASCLGGFSRQNTQEPRDCLDGESDDEDWPEDAEEALPCEMSVKNTFLCLAPVGPRSPRAHSAPPSSVWRS